jgi:hypothetical protein
MLLSIELCDDDPPTLLVPIKQEQLSPPRSSSSNPAPSIRLPTKRVKEESNDVKTTTTTTKKQRSTPTISMSSASIDLKAKRLDVKLEKEMIKETSNVMDRLKRSQKRLQKKMEKTPNTTSGEMRELNELRVQVELLTRKNQENMEELRLLKSGLLKSHYRLQQIISKNPHPSNRLYMYRDEAICPENDSLFM